MVEKQGEPEEIVTFVAKPGGAVRIRRIVPTVDVMREIVGGDLMEICPYMEPVALLYNASGDRQGLPGNLLLKNGSGQPYAVLHGTVLAVGVRDGAFVSLTEEQIHSLRAAFLRDRLSCGSQRRPVTDGTMGQDAGGMNRWRSVVLSAGEAACPNIIADRCPTHRKTVL